MTTYIVVACVSDRRWFDLDAERTAVSANSHGGGTWTTQGGDLASIGEIPKTLANPAGAPPLDCWFDGDPWTVARRLINLMCPRQVCVVCGEPRRRITSVEYTPGAGGTNGKRRDASEPDGNTRGMVGGKVMNKNVETLGWSDCGHNNFRRGVVFDPFQSAVTAAAAADLERGYHPLGEPMSRCEWRTGDVFEHMATIPDASIDLIVTSPPFLALRSYLPADHPDKHLEIGSEATPAAFLSTLLALTREWRRILAPHGSIAIELGDTYSSPGGTTDNREESLGGNDFAPRSGRGGGPGWPLAKSLCGIPTLYAWSLAYGHNLLDPNDRIEPWRVRNLIVWHRPNPPVGALGDKVRPSTSYIVVACTSSNRWFDLDSERTEHSEPDHSQIGKRRSLNGGDVDREDGDGRSSQNPAGAPPLDCWIDGDDWTAPPEEPPRGNPNTHRRTAKGVNAVERTGKSSDRGGNWATMPELGETQAAPPLDAWFGDDCGTYGDVWTIPTNPYKGSHYATYPPALPRRLIRLMCPRQVCVVCGEPRRRIVAFTDEYAAHRLRSTEAGTDLRERRNTEGHRVTGRGGERMEAEHTTLGWTDCDCNLTEAHYIDTQLGGNQYRRGIVLDPFAGSGTTLIAAAEQGRDAIGIDLDPRNLDLARQRIGLFLEETA